MDFAADRLSQRNLRISKGCVVRRATAVHVDETDARRVAARRSLEIS